MSANTTSSTLLGQVGENPTNEAAWKRFVNLYAPMIYQWILRRGAKPEDAEDLTQEVFQRLFHSMAGFTYDRTKGSFKGWLRTVTTNVWNDFRRKKSAVIVQYSELENVPAAEFWQEFEIRYDLEVLENAERKVQLLVSKRDWQIFCRLAKNGVAGREVSEELGMGVANVYVIKSRVIEKLREEIKRIF